MERSRQNVRGEPNMAIVHHLVPDGAPDGASRATNHPLCIYHEKMQFLVWIESNFYIFNKFIENIFHGESNDSYFIYVNINSFCKLDKKIDYSI